MIPFIGPPATGNYASGRQGRVLKFNSPSDPAYVVLHTMAGTVATTDARFKDADSKTSAHYGVELNGSVVQWVQEADTAFQSDDPDVDRISIGIEHEDGGDVDAPRSDALYAASSALVREICLRYQIPLSRRWVVKHSELPGATSTCPDALDAERIVAMALVGYQVQEPAAAMAATSTSGSLPTTTVSNPIAATTATTTNGTPADPHPSVSVGANTLQDIAKSIYDDPRRWTEIHSAIQSVIDEVPAVKLLGKMLTTTPDVATPGSGDGNGGPPVDPQPMAPAGSASAPVPNSTPQKLWGGSEGAIFGLQILYLTILAGLAILYFTNRSMIDLPDTLGPIPTPIPWFGALGAVLISLVGLTQHRNDWDPSYRFWHWARPLLGASFGTISVLIFQAGILAVGTQPSATAANVPKDLLYYLVAFVVGYREETFRDLIKRISDVIFSPGSQGATVTVTSMSPLGGPLAGGTSVTVLGSGFDSTDSVRFGDAQAKFNVNGDGQLTVTSPPATAGGTVTVAVSGGGASAIAGSFTYS